MEFKFNERQLYSVISRAMMTALSDTKFLTPSEFMDQIKKEYKLANSLAEVQVSDTTEGEQGTKS